MKTRPALFTGSIVAAALVASGVRAASGAADAPGFFLDLWEMAKTGGPFVTCFCLWQWQLERRDRMRLQSERDALLERVLTSINGMVEAIKDTKRVIERSG